jgi:hypothetical protein
MPGDPNVKGAGKENVSQLLSVGGEAVAALNAKFGDASCSGFSF